MVTAVNPDTGERIEYDEATGQWRSPVQDPNLVAGAGPIVRGPVANLLNTITGGQPGPLTPIAGAEQMGTLGDERTRYGAAIRGASRGAFTQAVEPAAALYQSALTQAGLFPEIEGTEDMPLGDRFAVTLNAMRRRRKAEEAEYPGIVLGGEIAGAVIPATVLGGSTLARTAPVKAGALTGGVAGGIYGAGEAESLEDVPLRSATGAGLGLLTGTGLAFTADRILSPGFRAASNKARSLLSRYMREIFPDEAAARAAVRQVGPEGTLLDVSPGTQTMGRVLTEESGRFKHRAVQFMTDRSKNAINRMRKVTNNVLGTRGKSIRGTIDELMVKRNQEYDDLISQIYNKKGDNQIPVDQQKLLNFVDQIDEMIERTANTKGYTAPLRNLRMSLFKDRKMTQLKDSWQAIHDARKAYGDDVWKAGTRTRGLLTEVRDQFDDVFPDQLKQANKVWSNSMRVEEAVNKGRRVLRDDVDYTEIDLARMPLAEKEGYMVGVARAIDDVMANVQEGGKVTTTFNKPIVQQRIRAVMPDEETFKIFMDRIGQENTYNLTKNALLSGSQTHDLMRAHAAFKQRSADLGVDIRSGAVRRGVEWLMGRKGEAGIDPKVADDLADLLLDEGKVTPEFISTLMKTPYKEKVESFINQAIGPATILAVSAEQ